MSEYCGQLGTVLDRRSPGLRRLSTAPAGRAHQRMLEAKASDDAKTKFLANMSHELRTPVNGVLGMLELVRHTEPGTAAAALSRGTARRSAEMLLENHQRYPRHLEDRVRQDRAGAVAFSICAILVEDVVENLCRCDLCEGGLSLRPLFRCALPTALIGDPARLRQILTNLIGNAVKFYRSGARWVFRVEAVEAEGPSVVLAFRRQR